MNPSRTQNDGTEADEDTDGHSLLDELDLRALQEAFDAECMEQNWKDVFEQYEQFLHDQAFRPAVYLN